MTYPLTVAMTPAFRYGGNSDWLLCAQLRCLSEQVVKDFDVMLIDPHYSKRVAYVPELAKRYRLNIVHIPYQPNPNIAKQLDCAVFNAAYCYSESPRIVRYSCWRFVRPNFTEICLETKTNVDFYFHNCKPSNPAWAHELSGHDTLIWDGGTDYVRWDAIPPEGDMPGAAWTRHSDVDAPMKLFPDNCYGNYMVPRDQWLAINGTDEVFTNAAHYEDMDFCLRARNAGMKCERRAHVLYRLHHFYGDYAGRANELPDHVFKAPCAECRRAIRIIEPNRWDLKRRIAAGEVEVFPADCVWVCKTCFLSGPIYHADAGEHVNYIKKSGHVQATVLPKYKIGRNLRRLVEVMEGKALADKIALYNSSWSEERFYRT